MINQWKCVNCKALQLNIYVRHSAHPNYQLLVYNKVASSQFIIVFILRVMCVLVAVLEKTIYQVRTQSLFESISKSP